MAAVIGSYSAMFLGNARTRGGKHQGQECVLPQESHRCN